MVNKFAIIFKKVEARFKTTNRKTMLERWKVILLVSYTYRLSWSAPLVRKRDAQSQRAGRCCCCQRTGTKLHAGELLEEECRELPLVKCAVLHHWGGTRQSNVVHGLASGC